jgi:hypothetical protein
MNPQICPNLYARPGDTKKAALGVSVKLRWTQRGNVIDTQSIVLGTVVVSPTTIVGGCEEIMRDLAVRQ